MATRKNTKLLTVLMAVLSCVLLVCSSAFTVFAAEDYKAQYEQIVAESDQLVIDSGIFEEGDPLQSLGDLINPDYSVRVEQAGSIIALALARGLFAETTADEILAEIMLPYELEDAKQLRDEILATYKITGAKINSANWEGYLEELGKTLEPMLLEMQELVLNGSLSMVDYVVKSAEEVESVYNNLLSVTNAGVGDENTTVGFYSPAQERELKKVFDSYVEVSEIVDADLNPVEALVYVDESLLEEYTPAQVVAFKKAVDAKEAEAISALKGVAKNDIELAYNAYMDLHAMISGALEASKEEIEELATALERDAKNAISIYEKKCSEEVKAEYSTEYAQLCHYVEEEYQRYVLKGVSSISDEHGVFTITVRNANGELAEIIPEQGKLFLYRTTNSAGKRNASKLLKDTSKDLSVAYYVTFRIENGHKYFTLPEKDANGKAYTYEIKFDLNKYYEKYCESGTFSESDKTSNVTSAHEVVEALGASLCYSYANGGEIKKLDYTLEGAVIVFTTTSNFNNLCIAGTGLDSLLTNPLFWLLLVVAIILVIVIIAIIFKHVRYAIRFNSNGGSHVDPVRAAKGEYFVMPADPTKEGYVFAGWYTDKELKNRFVGIRMIKRGGFKLHAKWVSPVAKERLIEMYDELRDVMRSFKKESFKQLLGLSETELIATMYFKESHIQLNLALNPEDVKKEGIKVTASKEKRFAEVPCQINISTEEIFATALELTHRAILAKGLQKIENYQNGAPSTEEERKNGFAYMIHNERVASTAEDYFELMRIAVKSYVMESDNGMFKPGDKVTLARIYINNEVACLYLPAIKGDKDLKPARGARFEDTPVEVKVITQRDMIEAYALIEKVMKANGFTKCPENANDLQDVKVPATNGFAYTLVF